MSLPVLFHMPLSIFLFIFGCSNPAKFSSVQNEKDVTVTPIPPIPITGSYLTGEVLRDDGRAAAGGVLDIVDEIKGTIVQTLNLNDNGEFSIPLSRISTSSLAMRIKDDNRFIYSVVTIPSDILIAVNRIRVAAGEPPVSGADPTEVAPVNREGENIELTLSRRMSFKLPANKTSSSGSSDSVWMNGSKQTISAVSLPAKAAQGAIPVTVWTDVENLSTESALRFAWKSTSSGTGAVRIVFSGDEQTLSAWNGSANTIPEWPGQPLKKYVITDYSQCNLPGAGQQPSTGELSAASTSSCGMLRNASEFPFNTEKTLFARAVSESATAIKLSPVYRFSASGRGPHLSAPEDQSISKNSQLTNLSVVVQDSDSVLNCTTALSATSSDTRLIPNGNIHFGGSVPNCTMSITPAFNQTGTSTIFVFASDGLFTASSAFAVAVDSAVVKNLVLGQVDGMRGAAIGGWTCQQNVEQSLNVEIYAKGLQNSGVLLATGKANRVSEIAVGNMCGTTLAEHRFLVPLPADLVARYPGVPIFVRAIDAVNPDGRWSAQLPRSGEFLIPVQRFVYGRIDVVSADRVEGWACQPWNPNPIDLEVFASVNTTNSAKIASGSANKVSEDEIGIMCGTSIGKHRFTIPIDPAIEPTYRGQKISIRGIDTLSLDGRWSAYLENSDQFTLP